MAATLFDPHGVVRLSTPEVKSELLPLIKPIALEAIRTERIIFHDLYPVPQSNEINMSLAIPIIDNHKNNKNVVAAVVYQIDPNYFLYPILQSLPTPSKTAELVMVRREKQSNEILFLNGLHHVQGAPLGLRKSLTETQLPSVKAVLGEEGIVRGIDYRGVPVLAANRLIPDSPWFLTAKIDLSEVQGASAKMVVPHSLDDHDLDGCRRFRRCPPLAQPGRQFLSAAIRVRVRTARPVPTV